jgi:restriction system protein
MMAKRGRSGLMKDVLDVVTKLPWWVGVLLALGFYITLHRYAVQVVAPLGPGVRLGVAVSQLLMQTWASYLQYILPFPCLLAAAFSARRASTRKALAQGAKGGSAAAFINDLSWNEFEMLVGEAFRQKGYKVLERGGAGPDGGIDLVLTKGTEKHLVQCKQWRALKVGVAVVRELYGAMASDGAVGGFVVTSGKFTQDAREFASGRNVELVDGDLLIGMLQDAKSSIEKSTPRSIAAANPAASKPSCPVCGSAMVKREAKRGPNAGNAFWGCGTYPKCTGTSPI